MDNVHYEIVNTPSVGKFNEFRDELSYFINESISIGSQGRALVAYNENGLILSIFIDNAHMSEEEAMRVAKECVKAYHNWKCGM